MQTYVIICALALTSSLLLTRQCAFGATYASGLKLLTKTHTSLSITWNVASGNMTASYYVITVDDSSNRRVQTANITDLTANNVTFTGLEQSKAYTFTLTTYDSDDEVVGSTDTLRVATVYDIWNTNAIIAIAVAAFIILTLIVAKLCATFFNPDKNQDKWKKEVLLVKQKQKEEKRRKKSAKAQRFTNDTTREEDLDEVNLPI